MTDAGKPRPIDPPMAPVALGGTAAWTLVGLALLAADAPRDWLWTCLAGALLGLAALPLMVARDRRRSR